MRYGHCSLHFPLVKEIMYKQLSSSNFKSQWPGYINFKHHNTAHTLKTTVTPSNLQQQPMMEEACSFRGHWHAKYTPWTREILDFVSTVHAISLVRFGWWRGMSGCRPHDSYASRITKNKNYSGHDVDGQSTVCMREERTGWHEGCSKWHGRVYHW